tara:strand:- start:5039 stop:5368 length:330 start_codon:yes stop_codon:yes gene_type:complete
MATNQFLNVPLSMPDQGQHIRLISNVLNNTIDGKLNSTGNVTLTASATSTTLTDARIGANSIILFMPTTANGNSAKDNLFVSARANGTATLTHASSSNTDQSFGYVVIG